MTLTPEQQWDSFTDEQKVEWLAIFMGWKPLPAFSDTHRNDFVDENGRVIERDKILNDWNVWRQVEEKVMEDKNIWVPFTQAVFGHSTFKTTAVWEYMKANLETRCKALYLAYSSLNV